MKKLLLVTINAHDYALVISFLRGVVPADGPVIAFGGTGLPRLALSLASRWAVVVAEGERAVGLGVDGVGQLVEGEVEPHSFTGELSEVEGSVVLGERRIPVLAVGRLLERSAGVLVRKVVGREMETPALVVEAGGHCWKLPVGEVEGVSPLLPMVPMPHGGGRLVQWGQKVLPVIEIVPSTGAFLVYLKKGMALRVGSLGGVERFCKLSILDVDALWEAQS